MAKLGENHLRNMAELGRREAIAILHNQPVEIPAAEPPKRSFEQHLQGQIDALQSRAVRKEGMSR